MVAIEINKFLSRLQSLQRLCSNTDPAYPKALLFVLGQDGRNNRGSITVLKYLYTLSVGKELLDETLDFASESLEDLIMLVKPNSLTVIWT